MFKFLPFLFLLGCVTPVITDEYDGKVSPLSVMMLSAKPVDVSRFEHLTGMDQVDAVNRFVNAVRYCNDVGESNQWITPAKFLATCGDCEDYASTKYLILRQLGWTDMAIIYYGLQNVKHAVLIIRIDGQELMLDNRTNYIKTWAGTPTYIVNAEGYRRP